MSKDDFNILLNRFDKFDEKLDNALLIIQEIKSEQKFCPAHNKNAALQNLLSNQEDKKSFFTFIKQNIGAGIIGIFFTIINVAITLLITGAIKI